MRIITATGVEFNPIALSCQVDYSKIKLVDMPFVYILRSEKNGQYYIGSTGSLETRVKKHNNGTVPSTKAYRPWKLIYSELLSTLSEARIRENKLKSWKKRVAIERLIEKAFVADAG